MKEGVSDEYRGAACFENFFLSFTRCSRRSFLYVDGVLDDGREGVMFLLALWRLRRYLFVYLSSKCSTWHSTISAPHGTAQHNSAPH